MRTIKLQGFPAGAPKQISVVAETYREALEALKLQDFFNPRKKTSRYLVEVDGVKTSVDLEAEIPSSEVIIHFQQEVQQRSVAGAGGNGVVKVVIGVVLIAVAIYMPPISAGWSFLSSSAMVSVNGTLAMMGVALIAGGIAQEMMPEINNETTDERSNTAGNYPNTVKSGTTKAMIFGTHRFGGHLFSFNLETLQDSAATLRDFTDIVWDESDQNRRDSWLTLYYNSESNEAGASGYYNGGDPDMPRWRLGVNNIQK